MLAAVTALALVGVARLRYEDVPRKFFQSDDAEHRRLEALFSDFGSDDTDALVVLTHADGWFGPGPAAGLRRVVRALVASPGVVEVRSLADVPVLSGGAGPRPLLPPDDAPPEAWAPAAAAAATHPLAAGQLLSPDGRTTLVVARFAGDLEAIRDLAPRVAACRAALADATAGTAIRARLTGVPAIRVDVFSAMRREQVVFGAVGMLVGFLVALALLRHPVAIVVASGAAMLGAVWALGAVGLAGVPLDILSGQLPVLVVVIGFTDAVHLMLDIRRRRAEGVDPRTAAAEAVRSLGLACFLTSFTTAIGFGSLVIGDLAILRRFGLACAVGVALAYVAVIVALPVLASWLPVGAAPARPPLVWHRLAAVGDALLRWPRTVVACGALATLACLWVARDLRADNRITEAVPHGTDAHLALADVDRAFGGALPAYVVVEWRGPLATAWPAVRGALDEAERAVRAAGFAAPFSIATVARLVPGGTSDAPPAWLAFVPADLARRLIRPELQRTVLSFRVADRPSWELESGTVAVETACAAIPAGPAGVTAVLTGTSIVARRNVNRMIGSLVRGLLGAAVIIFVSLGLALRSVRLGLLSLFPNVLPIAVEAALLVALGHPVHVASAVVFTVSLGIAVDDTIHVLSRFRAERAAGASVEAAVRQAYRTVGAGLALTTAVMTAGFGTLAFSVVPVLQTFGALACAGFAAALVGDLILLPATLILWGAPRAGVARSPSGAQG